jgi:hypothetical protein
VAVQLRSSASKVVGCACTSGVIFGCVGRFAIGKPVVVVLVPSFELVEGGGVVASEKLRDAGWCAALCGGLDGKGALLDFWVCVWVVELLLEVCVFVWCQLNGYRCSRVEIILQRHLQEEANRCA